MPTGPRHPEAIPPQIGKLRAISTAPALFGAPSLELTLSFHSEPYIFSTHRPSSLRI